jgi:hypothetical protein
VVAFVVAVIIVSSALAFDWRQEEARYKRQYPAFMRIALPQVAYRNPMREWSSSLEASACTTRLELRVVSSARSLAPIHGFSTRLRRRISSPLRPTTGWHGSQA